MPAFFREQLGSIETEGVRSRGAHELEPFGLESLVLLVGPLVQGEEKGVAVAIEGQGHFGDVPVV